MEVSSIAPSVPTVGPFAFPAVDSPLRPIRGPRHVRRESALLAIAAASGCFLIIHGDGLLAATMFGLAPAAVVGLLGVALGERAIDDRHVVSSTFAMALGAVYGTLVVFSVGVGAFAALNGVDTSDAPSLVPGITLVFLVFGAILFSIPAMLLTFPAALVWLFLLFAEFRFDRPRLARTVHWMAIIVVVAAVTNVALEFPAAAASGCDFDRALLLAVCP